MKISVLAKSLAENFTYRCVKTGQLKTLERRNRAGQHRGSIAHALQRTNTENLKQIFPEKELRSHSPSFQIQVFVSDLHIPATDLPILL
jgi:hypothetical protein